MKAYIQTQSDICNYQNIESAWCEAGLFSCNPQRALCMLAWETTSEAERSKTSTQFDIFNQVFVNSSSSDEATLQTVNELLNSTIEGCTIPSTPVRQYIWKLAFETEQLWAWSIVHQHDAKNLWSILKKQKTHVKRKRVVLKNHFYISTQELCDAVVEAEKTTKYQVKRKRKRQSKSVLYEAEIDKNIEEKTEDQSESEVENCIIVDC